MNSDELHKEIRGARALPRRAEAIELHTEDGLTLVGELSLPADTSPVATLVTLHPLPTAGGFMDSHILLKAALRLPALADLAVVRFNTRGTRSPRGQSEGEFGNGETERFDIAAAMAFAAERSLPNPWLVGWSFGTELVLKYGRELEPSGVILLSPPLHRATDADIDRWMGSKIPMIVLVPEFDSFLRPDEARRRFGRLPEASVMGVSGARHLWVGEHYTRIVLTEIVRAVNPSALPISWVVDDSQG